MNLLIDNIRLWDGTNAPSQTKLSVEIRNGCIHWIGAASEWHGKRANISVMDGTARTLIPGMMDCHVHYSSPGGPDCIAEHPREMVKRHRLRDITTNPINNVFQSTLPMKAATNCQSHKVGAAFNFHAFNFSPVRPNFGRVHDVPRPRTATALKSTPTKIAGAVAGRQRVDLCL